MSRGDPQLLLRAAPFADQRSVSTPRLMMDVIIGMLPAVAASLWHFGLAALLVLVASVAGAMLAEGVFGKRETLLDASAALTGVVYGLTLPPAVPLWIAFLGGVVAIGLGKLVWGGLGHNLFNPALVGRAFLQAAFPGALTTWIGPTGPGRFFSLPPSTLAWPFMQPPPGIDAISTASPLAMFKFDKKPTALMALLFGSVAGSLGETSAAAIIVGGLYLVARRAFDWRIPASILLTVALFAGVLFAVDSQSYASPLFMVLSGGLLFGAIFMATDPVTSPIAPRGAWIFGAGIGVLVVLIRVWGGLPEGVMYAILLMNSATPLIERVAQPRPFGRGGASE